MPPDTITCVSPNFPFPIVPAPAPETAVSGAGAGTIGKGKLGETQVIVSGGKIIIDTKVKDGEVLNNSIQLQ